MSDQYFSLRMRAERDGEHCGGGERIATPAALAALAAELVARAVDRSGGLPDAVHCTIERLRGEIPCGRLPDLRTWLAADWRDGRRVARSLLLRAGVAGVAADAALAGLAAGAAPGGRVMRGAMIVDAATGARLEPDAARGVRVSRMDLAPAARPAILAALAAAGLGHQRVVEALVLAGKVLAAPALVAELCWSDEPGYLPGYVADPVHGYQRIVPLKAVGDGRGGRALFVRRSAYRADAFIDFLERQPLLFETLGAIRAPESWRD